MFELLTGNSKPNKGDSVGRRLLHNDNEVAVLPMLLFKSNDNYTSIVTKKDALKNLMSVKAKLYDIFNIIGYEEEHFWLFYNYIYKEADEYIWTNLTKSNAAVDFELFRNRVTSNESKSLSFHYPTQLLKEIGIFLTPIYFISYRDLQRNGVFATPEPLLSNFYNLMGKSDGCSWMAPSFIETSIRVATIRYKKLLNKAKNATSATSNKVMPKISVSIKTNQRAKKS